MKGILIPVKNPTLPLLSLLCCLPLASFAANLQTQDLFFVGSHRHPVEIVGDDRNAFIRTEGGVLVYDYRKRNFVDNLFPGAAIQSLLFSTTKSRLLLTTSDGGAYEYNPVFRRATPARAQDFTGAGGEGVAGDLTGLSLGPNYFFLGDGVRDKWNRRVGLNGSRVFEYDNLWVMTQGFGLFQGSARRKEATPLWFGLYDQAAQSMHVEGSRIWFGGLRADGGLTSARTDLTDFKAYPAQQEFDFPNGSIQAMVAWKGFIWLATGLGVTRLQPDKGQFRFFRKVGSTDLVVRSLLVHDDKLIAGTDQGVARLESPDGEFIDMGSPGGITAPVYDLASKDRDLWAGARYGLFVSRKGEWKTLSEVSAIDVPEAVGQPVPSVGYHDSTLYWVSGNRIFIKPKKQKERVLLERDRPFKLRFVGKYMLIGWYSGFTAWNLERNLYTDFTLADGIPGTQVLSFAMSDDALWVGTDRGAMRIALRGYLP
jgi:hypothetical protein